MLVIWLHDTYLVYRPIRAAGADQICVLGGAPCRDEMVHHISPHISQLHSIVPVVIICSKHISYMYMPSWVQGSEHPSKFYVVQSISPLSTCTSVTFPSRSSTVALTCTCVGSTSHISACQFLWGEWGALKVHTLGMAYLDLGNAPTIDNPTLCMISIFAFQRRLASRLTQAL